MSRESELEAAVVRLQREREDAADKALALSYVLAEEREVLAALARERDDAHAALRRIAEADGYTERASWLIGIARNASYPTTPRTPRIPTGKVGRCCMTPTISDLALTVIAVIVTIALFNGWG